MATCTDWLMYLLWNYLFCGTQSFSGLMRFLGVMPTRVYPGSRAESCLRCWMPKKWWHLTSGRNSSQAWMNARDLQIRMDACLLWELWCGQSVLPLDDSLMVIGAIDANLGRQIVLQDCGWAVLAGFCLTWRLKTERRLQPVTNAL